MMKTHLLYFLKQKSIQCTFSSQNKDFTVNLLAATANLKKILTYIYTNYSLQVYFELSSTLKAETHQHGSSYVQTCGCTKINFHFCKRTIIQPWLTESFFEGFFNFFF